MMKMSFAVREPPASREGIQARAGEHVAGGVAPGQTRSEIPGHFTEELGAQVVGITGLLTGRIRREETTARDTTGADSGDGVRVDLPMREEHGCAAHHGQGRRQEIAGLGRDLLPAVLVPADGYPGIAGPRGVPVEVVQTQGADLRAPVSQVARVRGERLVIIDVVERGILRLITRGEHVHGFQEQRTDLEARPSVEEPGGNVGLGNRSRRLAGGEGQAVLAVGRSTHAPWHARHDDVAVAELIYQGRVKRERPHAQPRIEADRMAVLVDAGPPVAIGSGESGGGVDPATPLSAKRRWWCRWRRSTSRSA